jgi:hypothetical protein
MTEASQVTGHHYHLGCKVFQIRICSQQIRIQLIKNIKDLLEIGSYLTKGTTFFQVINIKIGFMMNALM